MQDHKERVLTAAKWGAVAVLTMVVIVYATSRQAEFVVAWCAILLCALQFFHGLAQMDRESTDMGGNVAADRLSIDGRVRPPTMDS